MTLTNQRGKELGGGASGSHEGCPGNILTKLKVLCGGGERDRDYHQNRLFD